MQTTSTPALLRRAAAGALLIAVLAPAGAAEAAGQKIAKFTATVEGRQEITWNVPRYNLDSSCDGTQWSEASGSEVITWKTKPTKIIVVKNPLASTPMVKYGTWDQFRLEGPISLLAPGELTRTGRRVHGIEPGECFGGGPTSQDTGPYDCGSRTYTGDVFLEWRGNRMMVRSIDLLAPLERGGEVFDNCPILGPDEPTEGAWTDLDQRYPVRDVFDRSQGLVEVLGRKTWTEKIENDHGTATTVTTFKVRLKRKR